MNYFEVLLGVMLLMSIFAVVPKCANYIEVNHEGPLAPRRCLAVFFIMFLYPIIAVIGGLWLIAK